MIVKQLMVGPFMSNCFIAGCDETKTAVVIDPGDEPQRILDALKRMGMTATKIYATHAHIDHIAAAEDVRIALGAEFLLHENEIPFVEGFGRQQMFFGVNSGKKPTVSGFVKEGDVISFGKEELRVVETPGHSPGGICFVGDDVVFAGDTLFSGSIGRTDLPGGDYDQLIGNIKNKLFALADSTIVYCGHGPETTIGEEKKIESVFALRVSVADRQNNALKEIV